MITVDNDTTNKGFYSIDNIRMYMINMDRRKDRYRRTTDAF